ncbi:MAG: hypothetical protein GXP45_02370 [bacterium]|nr:hypothetical protein [bacterium]
MFSFRFGFKTLVYTLIALFFFSAHSLFAYQASDADLAKLQSLKTQIMDIVQDNNEDLRDFYYQIRHLQNSYRFDERIDFLLTELKNYLWTRLQVQKRQAKTLAYPQKKAFLEQYQDPIINNSEIEANCIGWYNTLDDIAFAFNYPTALLIATRYRESNCAYYLPHNGDGPFQIINEDYGTGEITEATFVKSVVDFIRFSKNKYQRYENANSTSGYTVDLSYTGLTLTGIVRHAALYNGLSGYTVYGDAQPLNPHYLWDNYGEEYSGAQRFGLFPQTLRVLKWELEQEDNTIF